MQVINPASEQLIREINADSSEQLTAKFNLLKNSRPDWSAIPLTERVKVMEKFSELLEQNIDSLAATLTSEVGKPLRQSRNEINGARARIKWMTTHAVRYLSEETMTEDGNMKEVIVYEPLGVVCNISAWNYPYLVGVNVFVPALIAGNAVMYKPSEFASLTGLEIERLLKQAGVPDGVFQIAIGDKIAGEILTDLPFDGYFFTGSYATGKKIYEKVARKMVPCQLELGGKDPVYVTDDVTDLEQKAAGIADGAFYNNGQSCCSVERIYVHEKVYSAFVDAFVKEVQTYKVGDPLLDEVYIGPLTRKNQLEVLQHQVNDAVNKGAVVALGGKAMVGKGYFFEPTVLLQVNHSMEVMKEESFGPIIGIMKVKDDQEAIALMNDSAYGLTAAVYSSNELRAGNLLKQLDAGTGYWNCCDRVSAAVPWSGRKQSGIGATLSHIGLRTFTQPKALQLRNA